MIGILVYLVMATIFGAITRYVADSKGYDGGFWWGFFLGIIGLLVVGFRPDQTAQPSAPTGSAYWDNLQGGSDTPSTTHAMWRCVCGTANPVTLSYCTRCRRTRSEANNGAREKCPHCGAMNRSGNDTCFACGKPIHGDEQPVQETQPTRDAMPTQAQRQAMTLLESLGALHDQGILTDEEFTEKKKQILSRI